VSRLHQLAQKLTLLRAQGGTKEVPELVQPRAVAQAPGNRLGVALRRGGEAERAGVFVNAEREGGGLERSDGQLALGEDADQRRGQRSFLSQVERS
jgi:hypothetical protein